MVSIEMCVVIILLAASNVSGCPISFDVALCEKWAADVAAWSVLRRATWRLQERTHSVRYCRKNVDFTGDECWGTLLTERHAQLVAALRHAKAVAACVLPTLKGWNQEDGETALDIIFDAEMVL